jgi:hypothetical protein
VGQNTAPFLVPQLCGACLGASRPGLWVTCGHYSRKLGSEYIVPGRTAARDSMLPLKWCLLKILGFEPAACRRCQKITGAPHGRCGCFVLRNRRGPTVRPAIGAISARGSTSALLGGAEGRSKTGRTPSEPHLGCQMGSVGTLSHWHWRQCSWGRGRWTTGLGFSASATTSSASLSSASASASPSHFTAAACGS